MEDAENEAAAGAEQAGNVGEGAIQMVCVAKSEVAGDRIEDLFLEQAGSSLISLDTGDAEAL